MNVRADGLQTVLGPLLRDRRVVTAVLLDVDSGMVLDAWSSHLGRADLELLGAGHAELVRTVRAGADGRDEGCEVVASLGDDRHHVVRTVPDPHGDHLALSVVVVGRRRALERARRRLRVVSAAALTAGPTMARRPGALSRPTPPDPAAVPVAGVPVAGIPVAGIPVAGVPGPGAPIRGAAAPGPAPSVAAPVGRERPVAARAHGGDAALLSLGRTVRHDAAGAALALGDDVLPPCPPILRAVPPSQGAPSPADLQPDRPRAPIAALAPGPRRQPPDEG
ncbi:hypothetical protein [Pseudonocardia abyssalis]|uniref:Roadblock/LAMTOR2 domain-containing protein n=1 Tax=Pseudonocardia abyssalis TaxID=2792008 RepID=A0ABS6UQE4_9PSEU|nr:hypothetical protein [Pseudonocardia abyssalis]MBW0119506.1 hypothetical protein [Pseudonocardia abyssalis]MBW0134482.1 hypothetical protein [Pseudonocardia abyssalis]